MLSGSKLVRSWSQTGSNLSATSFEPASVMEFGFNWATYVQISWLFSSEPSPQSSFLSQRRHLAMHLKLSQRNRLSGSQSMEWQIASVSSDASPQSSSPSHIHSGAIQIYNGRRRGVQHITTSSPVSTEMGDRSRVGNQPHRPTNSAC